MGVMTNLSIAAVTRIEAAQEAGDHSFTMVALLGCIGLLTSFCLVSFGVDLGAAWL